MKFLDTKQKIQHNDFTIYLQHSVDKNLYTKYHEYHNQRIYSVKEILSALPKAHFRVLGIWDNFSFKTYSYRSERIHFLLQKGTLS